MGPLVFCSLFALLLGCVSGKPPQLEYALAKEALDAARMTDAARFSSGFFYKAESTYREACARYEDRDYEDAKALFLEAINLAEKAENSTRLIRHQTGEIL